MSIISWNSKGVGSSTFLRYVNNLIDMYHLDLLIIMETKVPATRAENI